MSSSVLEPRLSLLFLLLHSYISRNSATRVAESECNRNEVLTTYVAHENCTHFVTLSLLCVCVWKYAH
eukprot:jgi/Botrbrau1/7530/Bobra.0019s0018.1